MSGPVRKRTAHGRAAALGQSSVYESVSTAELRSPPPGSAAPVERREDGTITPDGARELARLRWEVARLPDFAAREIEAVPTEAFAPFDAARRDYLQIRRRELHEATGGVSAGVGATLRGEAWLTALAEYYATRAATTGDVEAADRAMRFLSKASTERVKAWDMASTEAQARSVSAPERAPWLVAPSTKEPA